MSPRFRIPSRGASIRLMAALAAALVLNACAGPAPRSPAAGEPEALEAPSAPGPVPAPGPAPTAGIIRAGNRWEVPGLKHGPLWYTWSPDRAWVGFHLTDGLWAVSADGRTEHRLVPGEAWRELAGWWQGGLVYLEHRSGDVVVGVARPGQPAVEVKTLPLRRTQQNLFIQGVALFGDHLALFPPGGTPLRVHLSTGAVQELSAGPMPPRCSLPMRSPDQRYVLMTNGCEPDAVRLIDLQDWAIRTVGESQYPFGAAWSPVANRWAALAGPQVTAAADGQPHAARLDLGDEQGQVTRLNPPQPLKLKGVPYWSADGRHLALAAEAEPASDSRGRDALNEVWVVDPAVQTWRKLAGMRFLHLQGWHPSGEYLVVWKIVGSAAPPDIGMLDAGTGRVEWLSLPPMEQRDATRLDERLMVVAGAAMRGPGEASVIRERPGKPPLALGPGQVPYMDALQARPPHVSWIEYGSGGPAPTLVVERRN